VPPEHTAQARELMGAGPLLCVEQAVVLETNATKAARLRVDFSRFILGCRITPIISCGLVLRKKTSSTAGARAFSLAVLPCGSARLMDAVVAWGDTKTIESRVQAHQAAGADHVCIQALSADTKALPLREWRELAGALIH